MTKFSVPVKPRAAAVHKWENGFELHGLPELPARGVVGLLGGAGKTTALLVLAGRLDPSCGWYAILNRYKGTPLGELLKKIDGDESTASYKPQAVERLRHLPDLKRNLADLKIDFEIVQALQLGGYDARDLEKMNADELQRISIAACLSKRADVYLLDCPSDHLDITQRVQVARLLKEKGRQSLIVVADNDITFLRWACDRISIFYGDETWSNPSGLCLPKEGVTAFTEGVLLNECIRIRPRGKPGESPAQREKRIAGQTDVLLELSGVQKHFGENTMRVDGEIRRNERIGLIGADGTGKSSLLKIIAGTETFSGLVRGTVKCAFKPEHLSQKAVLKGLSKEVLKFLGIPLRGHPTLTKSLRQRIAIARCLSADADMYVLDQPSEGLTAEERLVVAELLRAKPNVVFADHDAWLVARVADRCGLFIRKNGKSTVEWMDAEEALYRTINE